jgi:hypothetical protein
MSAALQKAEIPNLEDYQMHIANRFVASLFLTAALAVPVSMLAAPVPQTGVSIRVYDKNHKDYHNWDDNESKAWGIFLTDNHKSNHEYAKANKKEQGQYWDWRHTHPDNH